MQRNTFFTIGILSLIGGIFLFQVLEDLILTFLLLLFCLSLCSVFLFFYRNSSYIQATILGCLGICLGSIYCFFSLQYVEENLDILLPYEGLYGEYEGRVESIFERKEFYDTYTMRLNSLDGNRIDTSIKHLLQVPKNFQLQVGEELRYSGKLYFFEDFNGFSYKKYMLSQGLFFSTRSTRVDRISLDMSSWKYRIFVLRESLIERISYLFPQEEALFLAGILFGARENISKDLEEDFNNAGLTHFIAVSGFNITLCITFVSFLFAFFPVWGRILAVTITISIFSLFVGFGAPVVRAAIMGILGYIFLQQGNTTKHITLLAFTAFCMAVWSPLSLKYDTSLHLSFLAVMGIMYTQAYFKKIFFWVPGFFAIREACVLTLSALSFALALMIFQFGQVSLLAPIANIAVTWTIPLAMLAGTLSIFVSYISPGLGEIVGFFTWMLLHYDIRMVRFFGNIEFAVWKVEAGAYAGYFQILYFIVLVYILSFLHLRGKKYTL